MSEFNGFGPETMAFLDGLSANNSKAWFEEHRFEYDNHYIAPAKAFVEALAPELKQISPELNAEPRVNGSIFRINRDVRFSKDKTPYKDHIDFWFWDGGDRKTAISGMFLRVRSNEITIGAGAHMMPSALLGKFRSAVTGESSGGAIAKAVEAAEGSGYRIGGEHYKRMPKGFEAEGTAGRLLLHNALHVDLTTTPPKETGSAKFVGYCVDH